MAAGTAPGLRWAKEHEHGDVARHGLEVIAMSINGSVEAIKTPPCERGVVLREGDQAMKTLSRPSDCCAKEKSFGLVP